MRKTIRRLLAVPALVLAVFLVTPVAPASAHGERAQEAFLRMGTISFWDVKFSAAQVRQGQEFKVTGTAKVLETWPAQLASPSMGFISVVSPGPVVVIKERTINGAPAPDAIQIRKGGVYHFEMTLVGRRTGKWHIHPIFGVHGAGSLLGPGQYVRVEKSASGFTNPVQLASGKTVDLETIGTGGLAFWGIVWGLVGLAWLLYWIVPKRTVTRLPVTTQIPLNTDGMAYGLITKRDHRWMNVIVAVTLGLLAAGWIYQANAYPNKMPLQVLRFEPPAAATAATFVEAKPTSASYDPRTNTVSVTADVHNLGKTAATIEAFTTTTLTWTAQGAGAAGNKIMTVSPSPTVAAGQRSTLTLKITDPAWHDERLMPLNESRLQLTGVLRIKDESGAENFVNLQSFVTPTTT